MKNIKYLSVISLWIMYHCFIMVSLMIMQLKKIAPWILLIVNISSLFDFMVSTTGWTIKNDYQRKWFYRLAGGINQKLVVTTFDPYVYRYWNKQQLLHLVAFNFSYNLQLIRSESTDFTNLSRLRYLQAFPSNHWNTWYKNILSSEKGQF